MTLLLLPRASIVKKLNDRISERIYESENIEGLVL